MGIIRLVKAALFINECIRILFLAAYILLQPPDPAGFPRLVFITPAALFPFMALFILIDTSRYRVYLPLFTAGKCIAVFTLLVWIFFAGHYTMITELSSVVVVELYLLCGDLFAIAVILFIIRNDKKTMEISANKEEFTTE